MDQVSDRGAEASAPSSPGGGSPPGPRRPRPSAPRAVTAPVRPFVRAGAYWARSWQRYLSRSRPEDVPVVRPTVGLAGEAFVDEVVLAGFAALQPRGPEADRVEREVAAAVALYDDHGWCDDPERFHTAPPALTDPVVRTVRSRGLAHERLSFDSGYEPHEGEPGRARWLGYGANQRARALVLRHDEPRPWLVVVHGAMMGRGTLDLRLFRARWLHEELGLNVAAPVLPLHGPRRRGLGRSEVFPGADVLDDVHGAAQAVWDVRRLLSWIRHQDPGVATGITGISLGGYVTALTASLDDGLTCAIAGIPAVDLLDLIDHHAGSGELGAGSLDARRVGRVVSPLALTPKVPWEGRFVYAGLADRLVHPRRQVARLWEHWGRPEIHWFEGSHTGMFRSKPVGRFIREALTTSGLVADAPGRTATER